MIHFVKWLKKPQLMEQLKINTRFPVSDELIKLENELNNFRINHDSGILSGKFESPAISKVLISDTNFEVHLKIQGNLTFDIK